MQASGRVRKGWVQEILCCLSHVCFRWNMRWSALIPGPACPLKDHLLISGGVWGLHAVVNGTKRLYK